MARERALRRLALGMLFGAGADAFARTFVSEGTMAFPSLGEMCRGGAPKGCSLGVFSRVVFPSAVVGPLKDFGGSLTGCCLSVSSLV